MAPDSWPLVRLGDFVKVTHGFAFKTRYANNEPSPYVLFTRKNVAVGGGFREETPRFFHGGFDSHFLLEPGHLMLVLTDLSKAGDLLGLPAIVPAADEIRYLHNQRMGKVVRLDEGVDKGYLYALFRSPAYRRYVLATATQTTVRDTAPSRLHDYRFNLPPLEEQRRVAAVLGALDDKIESNRRLVRRLREVDRLAIEHAAAGMPWSGVLGDVADTVDCLHSRKPAHVDGGRWMLQLQNIGDDGLLDRSARFGISSDDFERWTKRIRLRDGDCVITNVGRVGAVARLPKIDAALGRNMTAIRPHRYPFLVASVLTSQPMRKEVEALTDAGTIMNALNVSNIPRLRFPAFPDEVQSQLDEECRVRWRYAEASLAEAVTLIALRDALLPKLVSGQIRVPLSNDSAEALGAAVEAHELRGAPAR